MKPMIKELAWKIFKNTGDINTYLEYKQITDMEENIKVENYENNKNKGDSNFRA